MPYCESKEEVLQLAALSARWRNNDAIDQAITHAVGDPSTLSAYNVTRTIPFNPVDKRTTAWVNTSTASNLVVTKGAPQVCFFSPDLGMALTEA